ncbi:hypothetical protein ACFL24_02845, partial [Patescibacteria group bacterium]
NFRAGDKRKTLRLGVEDVASFIKDTQGRSLLGQTENEEFPEGGYGVYLAVSNSYCILFKDTNSNQKYDGPTGPPFEVAGTDTEYVEHLKFRKDLILQRILKDGKVLKELEIVFVPPRPTMYFDGNNTVTKGEVLFGMEDEKDQREVFVNCLSGQIDVRSLEEEGSDNK